ncbi:hypothetical protein TYRP_009817 [Tyrophagus putrescentiae]|nr:hypothetical protein TYRP_009817 [Tyrophagus putrescentiae]
MFLNASSVIGLKIGKLAVVVALVEVDEDEDEEEDLLFVSVGGIPAVSDCSRKGSNGRGDEVEEEEKEDEETEEEEEEDEAELLIVRAGGHIRGVNPLLGNVLLGQLNLIHQRIIGSGHRVDGGHGRHRLALEEEEEEEKEGGVEVSSVTSYAESRLLKSATFPLPSLRR